MIPSQVICLTGLLVEFGTPFVNTCTRKVSGISDGCASWFSVSSCYPVTDIIHGSGPRLLTGQDYCSLASYYLLF
jgi:hypothetical protein